MIAANGATRALSGRARVSRRCGGWCARPSAGTASWPWPPSTAERLPDEPDAAALEAFLVRRRGGRSAALPRPVAAIVKLIGSGEYAVEWPGEPITGHFGLAVRDYTHSTAPNRRFPDLITQRLLKAALAGRRCRTRATSWRRWRSAAPTRKTTRRRSSARCGSRPRRRCWRAQVGASTTRSSRACRRRGRGCASLHPPVEGKVVRGGGPGRRRAGAGTAGRHGPPARLHRLRPRAALAPRRRERR